MYRSFDEEVFLSPESVVAGVVASAAFEDDFDLSDPGPLGSFRGAQSDGDDRDTDAVDPDAVEVDPDAAVVLRHVDESSPFRAEAQQIDRWARRALAANGFGG